MSTLPVGAVSAQQTQQAPQALQPAPVATSVLDPVLDPVPMTAKETVEGRLVDHWAKIATIAAVLFTLLGAGVGGLIRIENRLTSSECRQDSMQQSLDRIQRGMDDQGRDIKTLLQRGSNK